MIQSMASPVHSLLERGERSPQAVALVAVSASSHEVRGQEGSALTTWTLGDLLRRARRLARALIARGAAPGARVALVARSRPEWVLVDVACQLAGLVTVPVFKNELPSNLARILALTECRHAVADDPWQARKLLEAAGTLDWPLDLYLMDDRVDLAAGGELSFAELGAARPMLLRDLEAVGGARRGPDPIAERLEGLEADACSAIAVTSGLDGLPRGVIVTQANLRAAVAAFEDGLGRIPELRGGRELRHLLGLSPALAVGRTALWGSLLMGAPLCLPRSQSLLWRDVSAFRPTLATLVPGVLEKARVAVERGLTEGRGVKGLIARWAGGVVSEEGIVDKWRNGIARTQRRQEVRARFGKGCACVITSGAPLGEGTAEFFGAAGLSVREAYGTVETVGFTHLDVEPRPTPGAIGRPLAGLAHRLSADGELLIRGASVSPGYWLDAAETGRALDADGWLATGDLAEHIPEVGLRITGRKRDIIVLSEGRLIAPRPLEQALAGDALIADALLFGDKRPFLVALITLDVDQLTDFAAKRALGGEVDAWVRDPTVYAHVEAAIDRVNAKLPPHAHVKKFAILSQAPVGDAAELAATNTLRRAAAGQRYQSLLETFYAEPF